MKYYVAILLETNRYELHQFENLNTAFKFYLEEPAKRIILKTVNPKVTE